MKHIHNIGDILPIDTVNMREDLNPHYNGCKIF